jgi:hypothetical protein
MIDLAVDREGYPSVIRFALDGVGMSAANHSGKVGDSNPSTAIRGG